MGYEIINLMFKDEKPGSIFEFGVAGGILFKEYAQANGINIVAGMDINPNSKFPINFPDSKFIVHDGNIMPWPIEDNTYDIVFTVGTIMLTPNPFPIIKEMLRICKDKIILAESQDETKDAWGISQNFLNGEFEKINENTKPPVWEYALRINRDYKKVFKILNKDIEILEGCGGKTIIKCKK